MKWTGGKATSGGEKWTHTQGGSRNTPCCARVVVYLDRLKLCPHSMRGVDGGVRSDCHKSSVSHSRVTNVQPPAGAHLVVDVEESDTEDSGPPPLPTDLREESEGEENSNSLDETEVPVPRNQLSDGIHRDTGNLQTDLLPKARGVLLERGGQCYGPPT